MMKTVEELGRVQEWWLHLFPIFSSEGIVSQLPEVGKLFQVIVIWILKFRLLHAGFFYTLNRL